MSIRLITAPTGYPVTREELKQAMRVEGSDDDSVIDGLIGAAVSHLDGYSGLLGRAIMEQTWELVLDAFPPDAIRLPLGPLISVSSVKYDDADGIEQTVSASNYDVDTAREPGWVVPATTYSWPSTYDAINAVRVRFVCGFGSVASDVPGSIRQAIKLLVAHWYQNREASSASDLTPVPMGVDSLIAPHRRVF